MQSACTLQRREAGKNMSTQTSAGVPYFLSPWGFLIVPIIEPFVDPVQVPSKTSP